MDETAKAQVQQMINDAIAKAADFSTRKRGDTPTDDTQLTPRGYVTSVLGAYIPLGIGTAKGDIIVFSSASVATNLPVGADGTYLFANSAVSDGVQWASVTSSNIFGNGADGDAIIDGTSSINGGSFNGVSSTYSLSRDVYYTNLTISSNLGLKPSGYQIYVRGTTTINSANGIQANGVAGSSGGNGVTASLLSGGTGGAGGTGGSMFTGITVPSASVGMNGGDGGAGQSNQIGVSGAVGNNASTFGTSIGVTGQTGSVVSGGVGGHSIGFGAAVGGISGKGASVTSAKNLPDSLTGITIHADLLTTYIPHNTSASSPAAGGGGGGASDASTKKGGGGGGGGGTGGNGGTIFIASQKIINNATGGISANGGMGGIGGTGGDGAADSNNAAAAGGGGGGGGGYGGTGGTILAVYSTLQQNGSFTVTGGTSNAPGPGGLGFLGPTHDVTYDGQTGVAGKNGVDGKIWLYQV